MRLSVVALMVAWIMAWAPPMSVAADEFVFGNENIQVTLSDLEFYAQERVPDESWADFFSRDDAVARLAENLFVIRSLSKEAESSGVLNHDLINWQVELYRQRMMMEQYMNALIKSRTKDINWEQTAKDVYLGEKESFVSPEMVQVAHILVGTEGRSDEDALEKAENLLSELKKGEDFKILAVEHSDDPSAKTNMGSLGAVKRGQMVEPFEAVAFSMREPGELAGPVKTQFGYHIIQLERYIPESTKTFDQVKDEIVANLKKEIPRKLRADKVVETRSEAGLEVDSEKLNELRERLKKSGPH